MGIKRYFATADNTITNAFEENLKTRGTGSNMGASDILEVFSIYGQASTSSAERSRVLIEFRTSASTNSIKADRDDGNLPASGSVSFYLRMFNAPHGQTLPKDFTLDVSAIKAADNYSTTGSWDEGTGLDMELYKDKGASNWIHRVSSSAQGRVAWTTQGGDYYTDASSSFSASFTSGVEDLEIEITPLVEQWLSSSNLGWKPDYGVGVFLSNTYETASRSYYTKKFFGRGTEFYFKQPYIEARWDSSTQDDRGNFFYSSSLATAKENLNTLYLYNYFRGRLRNIPALHVAAGNAGKIYVSLYSGSSEDTSPSASALDLVVDTSHVTHTGRKTVVTGGWVETGIYTASVAITAAATPLSTVYDVWFSGGSGQIPTNAVQYYTGSIVPSKIYASAIAPADEYSVSITNLRNAYRNDENARFRVYTRKKDWNPTIYSKASSTAQVQVVESGSYEVYRVVDDLRAIPYGTGSDSHTVMSYDASGSYFDIDMSMLEPGYMYGMRLAFYNEDIDDWTEQSEVFKFKVESRQN